MSGGGGEEIPILGEKMCQVLEFGGRLDQLGEKKVNTCLWTSQAGIVLSLSFSVSPPHPGPLPSVGLNADLSLYAQLP